MPRYMLTASAFFLCLAIPCFYINLAQLCIVLLLQWNRSLYIQWMRWTQSLFGSLLYILTMVFCPVTLHLTGDHAALLDTSKTILISNHLLLSDWWYLWLLAHSRHAHGSLKICLKDTLKSIPIFGWGMSCFEFIFLSRKWSRDGPVLSTHLSRLSSDNLPFWLLLFPEGTVFTSNTRSISNAYCSTHSIEPPLHTLLPKSTGLYHALKWCPGVTEIHDITIAYSNTVGFPFDTYPIDKTFFLNQGPKSVHVHVETYRVEDIPGLSHSLQVESEANPEFINWLRTVFQEKDDRLSQFYVNGHFDPICKQVIPIHF